MNTQTVEKVDVDGSIGLINGKIVFCLIFDNEEYYLVPSPGTEEPQIVYRHMHEYHEWHTASFVAHIERDNDPECPDCGRIVGVEFSGYAGAI